MNAKDMQESTSATSGRLPSAAKIGLLLAALLLLVVLGRQAGDRIPQFAGWLEGLGSWAPVVFVIGYAVATVAFVPGALLTLAAGALFGLVRGTATVLVGATLGALLAFLVSRYVARSAIQKRLQSRFRFAAVDRAVARQGFKIVFLLRLSPLFPFNLLNYALGLTRVRFLDYAAASIGMLPATFLYVYYGKTIGDLATAASGAGLERGSAYWLLLLLGLVATVTVTALVTRLARRALDQEVTDES
jgi:uncharacterized membrane protein YdjX (TVP38/TMEM64 family)